MLTTSSPFSSSSSSSSSSQRSWQAPWSSVEKSTLLKRREQKQQKQRRPVSRSVSILNNADVVMNNTSSTTTAVAFSSLPTTTRLQRIFFSPHPDDVAYSAFGTASKRPRCCAHDDDDEEDDVLANHHGQYLHIPATLPLHSPALSSVSQMSDDATTTLSHNSPTPSSSSSSIFTSSRRNSAQSSSASSVISNDDRTQHQNALIVTVFSKSRCANGEIGARLKRNVEDTTVLRTEEDEAFARSIGCDLLQLGFPDSSARDEPSRRPDLAERAMKSAPGTRIRDVDHYIYEDVRRSLEPIVWMAVRAGAKIHLPLGVGCHVDHWMVRVAVLSILDELDVKLSAASEQMPASLHNVFSTHVVGGQEPLHERLIFYEDLPYADAQTNEHVQRLAASVLPLGAKAQLVPLTESDWCRKRAAVLAYASQMKPTILPSLYNHATRLAQLGKLIDPAWETPKHHLAAERIWIIDAERRRMALLEQQQQEQLQ